MYKFSIIVPCYNMENDVEKLFDMLSTDSYTNYEVIFVDDCSKDNSFEKMTMLSKTRANFSVYRPEKNGGPGLARNLGLKHAKGEYIVFCDSDDIFDIGALSGIEGYLTEHPEADMLVSPYHTVKNKKYAYVDTYGDYKHDSQVPAHDIIQGSMAPWGKIYKTDIIRFHGIEFPARRTGEDICFVVNYLTKCNVIYKYEVPYYTYVIAQTSITHKKSADVQSTFELLQPIYHEYFPELEIKMFASNHLLTKAKYLTDHGTSLKAIKTYFAEQNAKYPDWINHVDLEKQSTYRRNLYKAIYRNRPLMIRFIMFARKIFY